MDDRIRRTIAASFLATLAVAARGHAAVTTAPHCTIRGTPRADFVVGTPRGDVICALGGNDTIAGGGGDDVVYGGDGNDLLEGDTGSDRLYGGRGRDRFFAWDGRFDLIDGGPGSDYANADGLDRVVGVEDRN